MYELPAKIGKKCRGGGVSNKAIALIESGDRAVVDCVTMGFGFGRFAYSEADRDRLSEARP